MKSLLEKLNYKSQQRIAIIDAVKSFNMATFKDLRDVQIDTEIDQRYPYDFMIFFVRSIREVEEKTPLALHNLVADGVLWFSYPKKTSKNSSTDIDRDHGWNAMNKEGFYGIRLVSIDDDWSTMRFRNIKYIKSTSGRFPTEQE